MVAPGSKSNLAATFSNPSWASNSRVCCLTFAFAGPLFPAPMLLVIDNYDSFTYNLVQYFGELGAEMTVRRNDGITLDEIAALRPERICISPGPCTPREAGISNDVIRRFGESTPILGVCLG